MEKQEWMDREFNEDQITITEFGTAVCLAWDPHDEIGGYWVEAESTRDMTGDEYRRAHGDAVKIGDAGWIVDDDRELAVKWYRFDGDPDGVGNAGDFLPCDALLDALVKALK